MIKAFLFIGYLAIASDARASNQIEGFERLKSLAGTWTGTDETGAPMEIKHEVSSEGHAVVENGFGMVTIYHLDGDAILASHHCSAGNSPRLRSVGEQIQASSIRFEFYDIANGSVSAGHIHGVTLEWLPDGRLRQRWVWKEGDVETPFEFLLSRNK